MIWMKLYSSENKVRAEVYVCIKKEILSKLKKMCKMQTSVQLLVQIYYKSDETMWSLTEYKSIYEKEIAWEWGYGLGCKIPLFFYSRLAENNITCLNFIVLRINYVIFFSFPFSHLLFLRVLCIIIFSFIYKLENITNHWNTFVTLHCQYA